MGPVDGKRRQDGVRTADVSVSSSWLPRFSRLFHGGGCKAVAEAAVLAGVDWGFTLSVSAARMEGFLKPGQ